MDSANCTSICSTYQEGLPVNQILAEYLGACLYDEDDWLSFGLGWLSVFLWVFCQLPQLIENVKKQSSEALSVFFLLQWFIADSCSIVGVFLTHQLFTQKLTGVYFVFIDCVMLGQFFYYRYKNKRARSPSNGYRLMDPSADTFVGYSPKANNLKPVPVDSGSFDATPLAIFIPAVLMIGLMGSSFAFPEQGSGSVPIDAFVLASQNVDSGRRYTNAFAAGT